MFGMFTLVFLCFRWCQVSPRHWFAQLSSRTHCKSSAVALEFRNGLLFSWPLQWCSSPGAYFPAESMTCPGGSSALRTPLGTDTGGWEAVGWNRHILLQGWLWGDRTQRSSRSKKAIKIEDYMEVFTNGIPIAGWFIYNGKSHENRWELGVAPMTSTSIMPYDAIWLYNKYITVYHIMLTA